MGWLQFISASISSKTIGKEEQMESVSLTREELYREVWKTPMSHLAKQYGISDRGLAKICQRHNIPRPPLGYWAKLEAGKKVNQPNLPKESLPYLQTITITPVAEDMKKKHKPDQALASDDPRLIAAKNFSFPEKVNRYNQYIKEFRNACDFDRADRYGFLIPNALKECNIDIKVTKESYQRACSFLNGLLALFKQIGWDVRRIQKTRSDSAFIAILADKEKIEFKLKERVKQVDHILTEKEKKDKWLMEHRLYQKYDYSATGELTLTLGNEYHYSGTKNKWKDEKSKLLEDQLVEIVTGFINVIERTRENRIAAELRHQQYEEEARLRRERERLEKIENKRRLLLLEAADNFNQAQKIRALTKHIESTNSLSQKEKEWINWCCQVANDLDCSTDLSQVLETHNSVPDDFYIW